jgi:pimeloyl-ACP methyl ester carboxylesterase
MNRLFIKGSLVLALLFINACSSIPPVADRINSANQLAKLTGFEKIVIPTEQFELVTYQRAPKRLNQTLVIYIEGDGSSWKTSSLPSNNPTPINPVALSLAVQDTRAAVVYLARPCQFINLPSKGCSESIWTSARFSQGVIDSTNQVIELLKKQYQAKELILIGYSGGSAVASLIAAQRNDVKQLITVAGNLDTAAWVKTFGLEPLIGSLNPADKAKQLSNIKQIHFIGGNDQVIPKSVTQSYLSKLTNQNQSQVIEIKDYGHVCCWQQGWPALLSRINQ